MHSRTDYRHVSTGHPFLARTMRATQSISAESMELQLISSIIWVCSKHNRKESKYFKLKKDWHYPSEGAKVSREQDTLELKSGQGAEKQGTGRIWQDKQKMGAKPEKILGSDIIQGSPPIQPLQH